MRRKWWDRVYHGASVNVFFVILSYLAPIGLVLLPLFQLQSPIPIGWELLFLSILSPLFIAAFIILWQMCRGSVFPIFVYLRNMTQVFSLFTLVLWFKLAGSWSLSALSSTRQISFIVLSIVIILFIASAVLYFRKSQKPSWGQTISIGLFVLLICPYLFSNLIMCANIYADHAEPCSTVVAAAKVDKTSSGKWYVNLEKNEYLSPEAPLPLTKAEADATQPGDLFVLSVHPGALGIPWAAVESYTEP